MKNALKSDGRRSPPPPPPPPQAPVTIAAYVEGQRRHKYPATVTAFRTTPHNTHFRNRSNSGARPVLKEPSSCPLGVAKVPKSLESSPPSSSSSSLSQCSMLPPSAKSRAMSAVDYRYVDDTGANSITNDQHRADDDDGDEPDEEEPHWRKFIDDFTPIYADRGGGGGGGVSSKAVRGATFSPSRSAKTTSSSLSSSLEESGIGSHLHTNSQSQSRSMSNSSTLTNITSTKDQAANDGVQASDATARDVAGADADATNHLLPPRCHKPRSFAQAQQSASTSHSSNNDINNNTANDSKTFKPKRSNKPFVDTQKDIASHRSRPPSPTTLVNRSRRFGTTGGGGSGSGFNGPHPHRVASHPNYDRDASRNLFVGNLDDTVKRDELKRMFDPYGIVEDVYVKRTFQQQQQQQQQQAFGQAQATSPPPPPQRAFAFVRFENVDMAMSAKRCLDSTKIGNNEIKLGYGKTKATNCLWIGGLTSALSRRKLDSELNYYAASLANTQQSPPHHVRSPSASAAGNHREATRGVEVVWSESGESCHAVFETVRQAEEVLARLRASRLACSDRLRADFAGQSPPKRSPTPVLTQPQLPQRQPQPHPKPQPKTQTQPQLQPQLQLQPQSLFHVTLTRRSIIRTVVFLLVCVAALYLLSYLYCLESPKPKPAAVVVQKPPPPPPAKPSKPSNDWLSFNYF